MKVFLSLALFVVLFASCRGTNEGTGVGKRVLVLLDNLSMQQSFSKFFSELKERKYNLTFAGADDPTLSLTEYGEYLYDHLIVFSPAVEEFGGLIDVPAIVDFIDDGRNVLLAVDGTAADPVRDLATECGVEFDEEGSQVIDHFQSAGADFSFDHTTIAVAPTEATYLSTPIVVGDKPRSELKNVIFKGIGQSIPVNNGLNFGILKGYDTTYTGNPDKPIPANFHGKVGNEAVLVSALQARNNARILISGSLQLFSDKFFTPNTGNQYFCSEVSKWVFKERGLLKASNVTHTKVGETRAPAMYTVKDQIEYSVVIQEWNGQKWVPFSSNQVQLEFTMLDPYVRTFLTPDRNGRFSVQFTVPDVYGIYSFEVDFQQLGYSAIHLKDVHSVRPFRHDEYERFLTTANPYYLSSLSMMGGVFVLAIFLLFSR